MAKKGCETIRHLGVRFEPDPRTHAPQANQVTVLCGDLEQVWAHYDASKNYRFEIANPSLAKLEESGAEVPSVLSNVSPQFLWVRGVQPGITYLRAIDLTSGEECTRIAVVVGGRAICSMDRLPLFRFDPDELLPVYPDPPYDNELPGGVASLVSLGGPAPFGSTAGRTHIDRSVIDAGFSLDEVAFPSIAVLKVKIVDGLGNPKPGKEIAVVSRHDFVVSDGGWNGLNITGSDGTMELQLAASLLQPGMWLGPENIKNVGLGSECSMIRDDLGILCGHGAKRFHLQGISPGDIRAAISPVSLNDRVFKGDSIVFDTAISSVQLGGAAASFLSLPYASVNLVHAAIISDSFQAQVLPVQDPNGNFALLEGLPEPGISALNFPSLNFVWEQRLGNKFDAALPSQVSGSGLTTAAMIAEIALEISLAFVPGYDIVDVVKEEIWQPLMNDADPNHWVAAAGVAGLLADAGYLAGPAGIIGNAGTGILKALLKRLPGGLVEKLIKIAPDVRASVTLLLRYVTRYVPDLSPASDFVQRVAARVVELIAQWNSLCDSVLHLDFSHAAKSIGFMGAERFTKAFSDEAAVGVALISRHTTDSLEGLDLLCQVIPGDALDDSVVSIAEAMQRSFPAVLNNGEKYALLRKQVDSALYAARQNLDDYLRAAVTPHIGPMSPFRSMQEFEALRFLAAEHLRPEQVAAVRAIRSSMPTGLSNTEPFQKFISWTDAQAFVNGVFQPKIGGFIIRAEHVADLEGASLDAVSKALALPGDGFSTGYARITVPQPTPEMVGMAGTPKLPGFYAGGNDRLVHFEFPYTGNGLIASTDGRLRPELHFGMSDPDGGGLNVMTQLPSGTVIEKFGVTGDLVMKHRYDGLNAEGNPIWTLLYPTSPQ